MRAFVALNSHLSEVTEVVEELGHEAIPLTKDSVIDNLESFQTCDLVIVDSKSPKWVLREVNEGSKLSVAYSSVPECHVTCLVKDLVELRAFVEGVSDLALFTPVTESYVSKIADLKARFPCYA